MTEAQISKLTLGELEKIAARFAKAVADIREGQKLLGVAPLAPARKLVPEAEPADVEEAQPEDPAAAHRRRQFLQAPEPAPSSSKLKLSPAEAADRKRALEQFTPDPTLPDDIAAMENES